MSNDDLRQLQEMRELNDLIIVDNENQTLVDKLTTILDKYIDTMTQALSEGIVGIPAPKVLSQIADCIDVYDVCLFTIKEIVLVLTHEMAYSAFTCKLGNGVCTLLELDSRVSAQDSLKVGHFCLMTLFATYPNYLEIIKDYKNFTSRNKSYNLRLKVNLDKYKPLLETSPQFNLTPMICQPNPWEYVDEGGYLSTGYGYKTNLIRAMSNKPLEFFDYEEIPDYYDSVNYIQKSAWQIDQYMLDLVKHSIAENWKVKKMPDEASLPELQKYPLANDGKKFTNLSEEDKLVVKEWKTVNEILSKKITAHRSKLRSNTSAISLADKFKSYSSIWFPHSLDYRGRVYPDPVILNPQGSDLIKSFLRMAKPEPIVGQSSIRWTKIHISNLFGNDKDSYDGRIKWFDENESLVLKTGKNPYDYDYWHTVDKPWQFVQACREWVKYKEDPSTPISMLVAMDGSCSGIQHFSAMLRDPIGGSSVNLFPSDIPRDIYQDIADLVAIAIKDLTSEVFCFWKDFGIDRKAVKRSVMTLPYGLTKFSSRKYIAEYLEEQQLNIEDRKLLKLSEGLNDYLWKSIQSHLNGPTLIMDYLQRCALICAKAGHVIEWKTPGNLIVDRCQYSNKRVDCELNMSHSNLKNDRVRIILQVPSGKISGQKMKSSVAPNFVHSYDAYHLASVMNELNKLNIDHVCSIHDSIAVHPNHSDKLYQIIRETFVDLYKSKNVLQDLVSHVKEVHGTELPTPPDFIDPDMDFNKVLNSPYLFS